MKLVATPKLERSQVQVTARTPLRWKEVGRYQRPSFVNLLTPEAKALSLHRMAPALQLQHYLFQTFTEYHPGDATDKNWVLQQVRALPLPYRPPQHMPSHH